MEIKIKLIICVQSDVVYYSTRIDCEKVNTILIFIFSEAIASIVLQAVLLFNPRLTKPFFVTRLTKRGVVTTPSLDFPNRTPYDIDFGINR